MPKPAGAPAPVSDVPRLDTGTSFGKKAYAALKRANTAIDIYDHAQEIRRKRLGDWPISVERGEVIPPDFSDAFR